LNDIKITWLGNLVIEMEYIIPLTPLLFILAVLSSMFATKSFTEFFGSRGFVGIDIFKTNKPKIPLLGGLSIPLTIVIFSIIGYLTGLIGWKEALVVTLVISILTLVGLLDDFRDVSGLYKPVACLLGGLPIIFLHTYIPHLDFPFGVGFRISIIYIIMIPLGISVAANTVNMLDVINGLVATAGIIVLSVMGIAMYILGVDGNLYPIIIGIAALVGFLYYNKYPAKTFLGNAPALVIGGYIATLAIMYHVEFPTVVAMFPFIHNSFFFLNKIKGFVEHKQLNIKVTELDQMGLIHDARDEKAPITLLRFVVSRDPLSEFDAYLNIVVLFIFSGLLAVISCFLMG